jgi:hypothetical protein
MFLVALCFQGGPTPAALFRLAGSSAGSFRDDRRTTVPSWLFGSTSAFFFFDFLLIIYVLIGLSIEGGGHFGGKTPYFGWGFFPGWGRR